MIERLSQTDCNSSFYSFTVKMEFGDKIKYVLLSKTEIQLWMVEIVTQYNIIQPRLILALLAFCELSMCTNVFVLYMFDRSIKI